MYNHNGSAHLIGAFFILYVLLLSGPTSISLCDEVERSVLFARRRAGNVWVGGASISTPECLHGAGLHHAAVDAAVAALGADVVAELGPRPGVAVVAALGEIVVRVRCL